MPRAVDPFLIGQQIPITHSPLNRIGTQVRKPPLEIQDLMEGAKRFVEDYLFPVIEELTGIDLSAFLPLLDLLDLDFSSPIAFFESLINAVLLLPEIVLMLLQTLIDQLINLPETFATLISGFVELIITLPSMLIDLLSGLLVELANLTGIDLTVFLPLFQGLDFSDPISFFISLAEAMLAIPGILLGADSPLNALNLFNLIPTDLMSLIPMSNIGTAITNLLTDPFFQDSGALSGITGWFHDLLGGFGGTGAMSTIANGTVKELFGNLIPVSEGQIMPISGKAKWTGLLGSGNPIQLAVTGYLNGVAVLQSIIASHNTIPPTTDWTALTGQFTVPAGIDSIRTRLVVGSTATAGTVFFSDLSATKIGAMLQSLIRGTNVGEFLPDDIENLFTGIISNTVEILDRVLQGDFEGLVSVIGGVFGDTISDVEDRLNDMLHSLSPLNGANIFGSIADQFVPGIGKTIDSIVTNLTNLTGTGFSHGQAGQALRGQATALTTMGAQLQSVTSQLVSLFGFGVSFIDGFTRTSTTGLGADWITSLTNSNGRPATPDGYSMSWIPVGQVTNQFISIFNGVVSQTASDIQQVTMVLSSAVGQIANAVGFNDVWARVTDTTTSLANVSGTRVRFGGDGSVRIDNFLNGVMRPLSSAPAGYITPPGPGAILSVIAGFGGDLNMFAALLGNTPILYGSSSGLGTPGITGPTARNTAMGGQATGVPPGPGQVGTQAPPAAVYQYNAVDSSGAPGSIGPYG